LEAEGGRVDGRIGLGKAAEELAAGELERRGYRIVGRNLWWRWGELDVVARRGGELVVAEVRSRRAGVADTAADDAADSLQARKVAKVRRTTERWLADRPVDYTEVRFFAILVAWENPTPEIRVVEDAF
jgi:putative endonuclease